MDDASRQPELKSMAEPLACPLCCHSIDWYAEGESRIVDVGGVRVTVRFVGARGGAAASSSPRLLAPRFALANCGPAQCPATRHRLHASHQ